jgi:NAD(P)H-hydrate epimerase
MKVLTSEQMRAADEHAIKVLKIPSITLMENAATKVTNIIVQRYPQARSVIAVCGKGNNGGDGLAVARLLGEKGWKPTAVLVDPAAALAPDAAENWNRASKAGVNCLQNLSIENLSSYLRENEIVVDSLFGTGLSKPLTGKYAEVIQKINESGKEIVAVDVPSGLSSDSGEMQGPAIHASTTVALAAFKFCHLMAPGSDLCGETYVVDIGIPTDAGTTVLRAKDIRKLLPSRKPESHKGAYGHAVIVAGSTGKSGAAYLSAKSALRCGAGLVTAVSPANVQRIVATMGPEIMTQLTSGHADFFSTEGVRDLLNFLKDKSSAAVGPGIGTADPTVQFFQSLIPKLECPLVIDADGLNVLANDKQLIRKRKPLSTVLTPHPGEIARLMNTKTETVQKDRIGMAKSLAAETASIVVLKGYRTVIADPEGQTWINITGAPALASAGTGDVLTGIITGFLAQKLSPLEAALAGVFAHGLTGNLFEQQFPNQALNALDILDYWNRAVRLIQTEQDIEGEYLKLHFAF